MPEPEERKDDFSYKPIGNQNLQGKAEYNPNRTVSPDELIQKLYSLRVPEPTFNQDKADRLQRMGRVNQLGRGVSVLGDMLATGLGAPIKRRNPDNVSPALVQSYLDNLDKYKAEKDANILRNYQKDIDDIRTGLSHSYREQATELARQKQADWMKAKEADQRLNYAKWSADWDLNRRKAGETERHNKESERIAAIRANKTGQKSDKKDKPYMQVGVQNLTEGEARQLYDEAISYYNEGKPLDQNTTNTYLKGILAAFENNPVETKKEIVAHYLRDTERQLNQHRAKQGLSNEPVKSTLSKPKATKTDWNKYELK